MAWVYLDDHFPEHPKVLAAGGQAAWLFVAGLAYVKRHGTRGRIPKTVVPRLTDLRGSSRLAHRLCTTGLWLEHEADFEVNDYDEWNGKADARTEKARQAAQARWSRRIVDAPSIDDEDAPSIAIASSEQMLHDALTPPHPTRIATSHPPTNVSGGQPTGGGRALIDQATALVVADEIARRGANGDPVRSPEGYARTRHAPVRSQHEAMWVELLERTPDLTAQQLADYAAGRLKATPLDDAARAARALRERDRSCPTCHGSGVELDADDLAVPCSTCRPDDHRTATHEEARA